MSLRLIPITHFPLAHPLAHRYSGGREVNSFSTELSLPARTHPQGLASQPPCCFAPGESAHVYSEDNMDQLTTIEAADFQQQEEIISRGLETFVEVGNALMIIRDRKYWRREFKSFDDYCERRWEFQPNRANRLISAAKTMAAISENVRDDNIDSEKTSVPMGTKTVAIYQKRTFSEKSEKRVTENHKTPLPENERQVRPLIGLSPEQQKEAWQSAVDAAPDGKPTAKAVAKAVEKLTAKPAAAAAADKPEPDRLDKAKRKIPKKILKAWEDSEPLRVIQRELSGIKSRLEEHTDGPLSNYWVNRNRQALTRDTAAVFSTIKWCLPYAVCPYCGGEFCGACHDTGWMPEEIYKAVPRNIKGEER